LPSSNRLLRCPLTEDNSDTRKEKETSLKQRVELVCSEEEEPTQEVNKDIEKMSFLKNH
jgi:hypothetical protein